MAAWRPELSSTDQVLKFYENSPLVKYKVFAGNKPDINCLRWEYEGSEKQEGLHELENACNAITANPTNINSYTLQLVRSNQVFKTGEHKAAKRIEDAINIVFQLNFDGYRQIAQAQQPQQMGAMDSAIVKVLQQQTEQLNVLTSLLTAKIGADNEIEEEAEATIGERLLEPVFGVLENPVLQEALAEKICGWLMPNNKPAAIAGINKDENDALISKAVEILKKHDENLGADLMKLAEIAERNDGNFSMLINLLRKQ